VLEDGALPDPRVPFQDEMWNAVERTFIATVEWPVKNDGSNRWEFFVVFSEDFKNLYGRIKVVGDGTAANPDKEIILGKDLVYFSMF